MPYKTPLIILIIVTVGISVWFLSQSTARPISNEADLKIIDVAGKKLKVEVVDTADKRSLGLSGRESIGDADGMLFVFDEPGYHGIWMKDMKFAIDIIWLDENFNVVEVAKNVSPESFPKIFTPKAPAKYVLELGGGKSGF